MKIDLYNNTETFIKETKQDWNVSAWLRKRGITLDDLDSHTQISDVITLIRIREELGHKFNLYEKGVWDAYWGIVYNKRFPLTKKFWNKFEQIVKNIDSRDQLIEQQRQYIKALRLNPNNNMDHDNKAKGSCQPRVTNTKREQLECRRVSTQ